MKLLLLFRSIFTSVKERQRNRDCQFGWTFPKERKMNCAACGLVNYKRLVQWSIEIPSEYFNHNIQYAVYAPGIVTKGYTYIQVNVIEPPADRDCKVILFPNTHTLPPLFSSAFQYAAVCCPHSFWEGLKTELILETNDKEHSINYLTHTIKQFYWKFPRFLWIKVLDTLVIDHSLSYYIYETNELRSWSFSYHICNKFSQSLPVFDNIQQVYDLLKGLKQLIWIGPLHAVFIGLVKHVSI